MLERVLCARHRCLDLLQGASPNGWTQTDLTCIAVCSSHARYHETRRGFSLTYNCQLEACVAAGGRLAEDFVRLFQVTPARHAMKMLVLSVLRTVWPELLTDSAHLVTPFFSFTSSLTSLYSLLFAEPVLGLISYQIPDLVHLSKVCRLSGLFMIWLSPTIVQVLCQ